MSLEIAPVTQAGVCLKYLLYCGAAPDQPVHVSGSMQIAQSGACLVIKPAHDLLSSAVLRARDILKRPHDVFESL